MSNPLPLNVFWIFAAAFYFRNYLLCTSVILPGSSNFLPKIIYLPPKTSTTHKSHKIKTLSYCIHNWGRYYTYVDAFLYRSLLHFHIPLFLKGIFKLGICTFPTNYYKSVYTAVWWASVRAFEFRLLKLVRFSLSKIL